MHLTLLPESADLAAAARSLIARHLGAATADRAAVSGPLWDAAVKAGWPEILAAPVLEYAELEAAICLLQEVGRAQPPIALQVSMAARWFAAAVPGLAGWRGQLTGQPGQIVALSWPLGTAQVPSLRLSRSGRGYRLDGDLGIVREAAVAGELLATADLDGRLMLVVFPLQCDGVSVIPIDGVGGLRQARVRVAGALVGDNDVSPGLPSGDKARADALLLILDAAELAGCAEMALEMTVQHARTRRQFGRPLGAFQAVRHRIADMTSDVEQSRWLLYRSAATLARGEAAAAKRDAHALALWNSVALERVIMSAHQVHGGVGFIRDHPLHLYFGRQKASMFSWGQPADHAESLLAAVFPDQGKVRLDL
jgi:alkylation response protein AidB-like acyl-CoA dehydrogenase